MNLLSAFSIASLLLFPGMAHAQKPAYDTLRDEKNGSLVFKGSITLPDLMNEPSFGWMREGANAYQPNAATMKLLTEKLKGHRMLVFMGTWCEDSQNIILHYYKVLQLAGYPMDDVMLYGVDRAKTTGTGIEKTYQVSLVPTIILYSGEKETGRIIESVHTSIEDDLLKLLEGK